MILKKVIKIDPIKWAKNVLRRNWKRTGYVSIVMARQRVERGCYACAWCGDHFKRQDMQVDHIDPVVSTEDPDPSLEVWVNRLLCGPDGLQMMCLPCHKDKSAVEMGDRAKTRRKKKGRYKRVK